MDLFISKIGEVFMFLIWILAWFLGGFLIVTSVFKAPHKEATILGFCTGLIFQVWVANWVARILSPIPAFWISAVIILIIGLSLVLISKNLELAQRSFHFPMNYWAPFIIIVAVFFMIGRGLTIFDDYQNIPVTSYIASGAIPPSFVLNPEVSFDYHYLMLLNAAQWMRIANLLPWTALDLNRALFLGLSIILASFLGYRLTRNRLFGWLTAIFFAFAGGLRWLLLFIPAPALEKISLHITMIGSGMVTADSLAQGMIKNWAIEGAGPIAFPFAFGNGFHSIPVFNHDGTGMMGTAVALLIILFYERWKNASGKLILAILLSALALVDEIWFIFFICSAGMIFIIEHIHKKRMPTREKYFDLVLLIILPVFFSVIQGGVLTGIAKAMVNGVIGNGAVNASQYFTIGFPIHWPPAIISSHLGVLSLTQWPQIIVAFCEVGPILLVYPLFIIWAVKAYRAKQTVFSILAIGISLSLLMVFVEYQGSAGISASKRLILFAVDLLILFAVPLLSYWLGKKRIQTKMLVTGIAFLTMVGGMVYFLISIVAIQRPVLTYFIEWMDASVQNIYWDRLDKDAMVFDFVPSRSVTIFARPVKSYETWYVALPEYDRLKRNPDPYVLNDAGFSHVYLSRADYQALTKSSKELFEDPCVVTLYENEDWQGDFRWLMDISACKK